MSNFEEQEKQLRASRERFNLDVTKKVKNICSFFEKLDVKTSHIKKNLKKDILIFKAPLKKIRGCTMLCCPKEYTTVVYVDAEFYENTANKTMSNCQLTHELLHGLSDFCKARQHFMGHQIEEDKKTKELIPGIYIGINEATTQLFSEMIEGITLSESEDYLFFLKNLIARLADIIGIEKLASQYLNNDLSFEKSFNKISHIDFATFATIVNSVYNLSKKQKYKTISDDELKFLNKQKEQLENFVDDLSKKYQESV